MNNKMTENIYPSTNVAFVYAVIAMCLELKEAGYTVFLFVLQLCVNGINPIMKTG